MIGRRGRLSDWRGGEYRNQAWWILKSLPKIALWQSWWPVLTIAFAAAVNLDLRTRIPDTARRNGGRRCVERPV